MIIMLNCQNYSFCGIINGNFKSLIEQVVVRRSKIGFINDPIVCHGGIFQKLGWVMKAHF